MVGAHDIHVEARTSKASSGLGFLRSRVPHDGDPATGTGASIFLYLSPMRLARVLQPIASRVAGAPSTCRFFGADDRRSWKRLAVSLGKPSGRVGTFARRSWMLSA